MLMSQVEYLHISHDVFREKPNGGKCKVLWLGHDRIVPTMTTICEDDGYEAWLKTGNAFSWGVD
jgi:hypothetical protein